MLIPYIQTWMRHPVEVGLENVVRYLKKMDIKPPRKFSFEGNVQENFTKFIRQFEVYMLASGGSLKEVPVKIAILLNVLGEEGIEIYSNFELTDAQKKVYKTVVEEFMKYVNPRKSIVYERFLFYNRKQECGESFDHFVNDLRTAVKRCEFKDSEEMLRDRIIFGISDKEVQQKLIVKGSVTLADVVTMCRTNEAAKGYIQTVQTEGAKAVEVLQKKNASSETYKKKQQDDSQKKQETVTRFLCTRCKTKHCVRNCLAFGKKCHRCGKMNHFKICCRVKEVREVKNDEFTASGSEATLMVEGIKKYCSGVNTVGKAWYEDVKLYGSVVKMKLDTGAEVKTIPEKLVRQLKCMNKIVRDTKMLLESWGGYKIKPLGFTDLDCTVKDDNNKMRKKNSIWKIFQVRLFSKFSRHSGSDSSWKNIANHSSSTTGSTADLTEFWPPLIL
ncbi:uncharacterized protein LOC135138565 [Zophobas morio]|uniref:uncharacterized protein LOC135138565 n=1 Tax=Zophobas morio TaxID=2755281 RepID=UPI003083631F